MIEYIYKGFKLSYTVNETNYTSPKLYEAHGNAIYLLNNPGFAQTHFHAEHETQVGVEHKVKRILENYVDFELKNFSSREKQEAST